MAHGETTCWSLIEAAAAGNTGNQDEFVRRYHGFIRAVLKARWCTSPCSEELDDAVQEVFVECFRPLGILSKVDRSKPGGFRAFLVGTVRNVARRFEARRDGINGNRIEHVENLDQIPARDDPQSKAMDRAWASALVREAAELLQARALEAGPKAIRRTEILRLRFRDGVPIREIAARWNVAPAVLHHEYAKARDEFREALHAVVAQYNFGTAAEIALACRNLLMMISG